MCCEEYGGILIGRLEGRRFDKLIYEKCMVVYMSGCLYGIGYLSGMACELFLAFEHPLVGFYSSYFVVKWNESSSSLYNPTNILFNEL